MIISRTPYRLSFFGGGTDYPAWYRQHGGAVLATAIDKFCYISCRWLPPFFEHRSRIVWSKIETVHATDEIQHPAVRASLQYMNETRGLELHHDGDLPARSGIGSSSTFTVGLLHALHALRCRMISRDELARQAIHVEQEVIRETVGSQDQITAAYGGLNRIEFKTDGSFVVMPVVLSAERRRSFQDHLLLFFTGISRVAAVVADSYARDIAQHASQLSDLQQFVDSAVQALTGNGDIAEIGEMLHQSWLIKRSLSTEVSTPFVDALYERARRAGALGGKLAGAGGGGFMLLFARPEDHRRIRQALDDCLHVPFEFEMSGSQIIYYGEETAYPQTTAEIASHVN